MHIAIIGAGMAGLTAARALDEAGLQVTVFEKGRGLGGRLSTRRGETGQFDHGAAFFTVRHPAFITEAAAWREEDAVEVWPGKLVRLTQQGVEDAYPDDRYVSVPGMSALGRFLAEGLNCQRGHRVQQIEPTGSNWRVFLDDGSTQSFDGLILAIPAPQAVALLSGVHHFAADIEQNVHMTACWSLLAQSEAKPAFDAAFIDNDGPLAWVAHEVSKPGRHDSLNWVAHSRGDWAEQHLHHATDWVQATLTAAMQQVVQGAVEAVAVHRWRYARTARALGQACLFDRALRLGIAGDWCLGDRVEHAFLSGQAVAQTVLTSA